MIFTAIVAAFVVGDTTASFHQHHLEQGRRHQRREDAPWNLPSVSKFPQKQPSVGEAGIYGIGGAEYMYVLKLFYSIL